MKALGFGFWAFGSRALLERFEMALEVTNLHSDIGVDF